MRDDLGELRQPEPLLAAPGLLSFARTRRLCYVANFTATCPEMAPDGWHLYVGTAVPRPAVGDFDEQAETELLLADLRDEIPGFDRARILSTVVTRDDWPPQRAVAGSDLPRAPPSPTCGTSATAVKEYANGGTTACAETAQLVAAQVAERYPLQPPAGRLAAGTSSGMSATSALLRSGSRAAAVRVMTTHAMM